VHHDASDSGGRDAAPEAQAECASTFTCSGTLLGGVVANVVTCSVSGEDGLAAGFGEVSFNFTASIDDAGAQVTGSGNVSTKVSFQPGVYGIDAGLWNDDGTTGVAADSLWTVTWPSDAGAGETAVCNGIASPDEPPSVCAGAALDVTSVDSCGHLHGTFEVTIPAYMMAPAVTVDLAF